MPRIDSPRPSILALVCVLLSSTLVLSACDDLTASDGDAISVGWGGVLCGARNAGVYDGFLVLDDLVYDCGFHDEASLFDWHTAPIGIAGQNEVSIEIDDSFDTDRDRHLEPERERTATRGRSALLTNLKRDLTSGFGAMVQCHYASEDYFYAASGAVYMTDQREQGVPPRFQAYVQLTFYADDRCLGTPIDGVHRSNAAYHPELVEVWRPLATGTLAAPEGTRSVAIAAVVDVPSGNPIGQSYQANFDLLSLAVMQEAFAPDP